MVLPCHHGITKSREGSVLNLLYHRETLDGVEQSLQYKTLPMEWYSLIFKIRMYTMKCCICWCHPFVFPSQTSWHWLASSLSCSPLFFSLSNTTQPALCLGKQRNILSQALPLQEQSHWFQAWKRESSRDWGEFAPCPALEATWSFSSLCFLPLAHWEDEGTKEL